MAEKRGLQRLGQVVYHVRDNDAALKPSIVQGPTAPGLLHMTLGQLLAAQCLSYKDSECVVVPWTSTRWTYNELKLEADQLAHGLLVKGVQKDDRIGIIAGNCEQYISVLFAAAQTGALLVLLNNQYSRSEVLNAVNHTECRFLFATPYIGNRSMENIIGSLGAQPKRNGASEYLEEIIILRGEYKGYSTYDNVKECGLTLPRHIAQAREAALSSEGVCNLQFTSGSTGDPKAAMLTHQGMINNARFVGDRMKLTSVDSLCCPPPLFHCFGLVLGTLAVITHGSKIVFPSETFNPDAVLQAISDEKCTALHGVPTMFESILDRPRPKNFDATCLRTGIIAGAPVSKQLMCRLFNELNMTEYTSSYGLTETSPTCFNAFTSDPIEKRLTTAGRIMPHAKAKVVNRDGSIAVIKQRGELYISGYLVTKGYWKNPEKTSEALVTDIDGITWLKTGDEAYLDAEGYCTITGRFKDIIIRGGENIYPLEIEERLVMHPAIETAFVIGIPDQQYGEVVGAFIGLAPMYKKPRPSNEDLRRWTLETLGRHKTPRHFFVFGEEGIGHRTPVTGSGKILKERREGTSFKSLY
ncbi:hypothetical protein BDV59DRAFT_209486 [Aspergillus ambiguus]|uniref:uncharacterized protein n=1 Tax=Aspergillus ambiguus TaxID=176160 RepID=UPI003CCC929D